MRAGADMTLVDSNGETALDLTTKFNAKKVRKYLQYKMKSSV